MKKAAFIILVCIFYSYSCSTSKKGIDITSGAIEAEAATGNDSVSLKPVSKTDSVLVASPFYSDSTVIVSKKFPKPIRDKGLYASTADRIYPDSIYISADTLHILTKKILECDPEDLKLIWDGMFLKSAPPQALLRIMQVSNPDCKQQNTFHLMYNLAPVRYKQDTVHVDKVILKIRGYKYPVAYSY